MFKGENVSIIDELPSIYSDAIGRKYAISCDDTHKKNFGQYLTPVEIANLMSDMVTPIKNKNEISILDPGCGVAILTSALCEKILANSPNIKTISCFGYELDPAIIPYTHKSLEYLNTWLSSKGIEFRYEVIIKDFIIDNSSLFDDSPSLFQLEETQKFDIIISNPPYFKISKDDIRAKVAHKIVFGQPNIYGIFLYLSALLLEENGQLIYITPRSYTSGSYFKAFRKHFLNEVSLRRFHLFSSRNKAFNRDAVLQENIILHAVKNRNNDKVIEISTSSGSLSDEDVNIRSILMANVLIGNEEDKKIFLPITEKEESIIEHMHSWKNNLNKLGFEISTGKIVPFRNRNYLLGDFDIHKIKKDFVPLIWMNHIKMGEINWPIPQFRKEQYFHVLKESRKLLIPAGNYVLMRRFSAKEEKRRINTAPLLRKDLTYETIGLENHLNYIYRKNGKMTQEEAVGLSAIFNTEFFDIYFRTFNGNTEVSATEMRELPLPNIDVIHKIGVMLLNEGKSLDDIENLLIAS
ncbi:MAG: Eco57I restriction-modification methylase domain-containing protein [Spirochaetales bacterium]|jgi:adenine-specific DNA-methyltransferase|nr:Eco57I restriction-modification methylase domain-containing protein [Spirochaetales bacterium]